MASSKIQKIAKRIVKEDRELFETLMEFERTKKIRTKQRLNFTIDKNIAVNFKKMCRKKGYNMSAKIEKAMQEMLKKN